MVELRRCWSPLPLPALILYSGILTMIALLPYPVFKLVQVRGYPRASPVLCQAALGSTEYPDDRSWDDDRAYF